MYHDLCIPYTTSQSDLLRTLSFLVELSYSVAAISLPLPSGNPGPSGPSTTTSSKPSTTLPPLPSPPAGLKPLLTRLTLPLLTNSDLPNTKLHALHQTYDLVALRPTSEKTLLLATSAPDVDLISLDLSARWPFHFRPRMFSAAVKRGVWFEICYSPALDSSATGAAGRAASGSISGYGELIPASDAATARRNLISNGTSLIRALRGGKNVIFSSEAKTVLGLRAPLDVVNFGVLLGLSAEKGLEAVRDGPSFVMRAARARREGWRGVLLGVQVKNGSDGAEGEGVEREAARGVKRKVADRGKDGTVGDDDAAGADKGEKGAEETQISPAPVAQVSKRQMKRLAKRERQERQEKAVDAG